MKLGQLLLVFFSRQTRRLQPKTRNPDSAYPPDILHPRDWRWMRDSKISVNYPTDIDLPDFGFSGKLFTIIKIYLNSLFFNVFHINSTYNNQNYKLSTVMYLSLKVLYAFFMVLAQSYMALSLYLPCFKIQANHNPLTPLSVYPQPPFHGKGGQAPPPKIS